MPSSLVTCSIDGAAKNFYSYVSLAGTAPSVSLNHSPVSEATRNPDHGSRDTIETRSSRNRLAITPGIKRRKEKSARPTMDNSERPQKETNKEGDGERRRVKNLIEGGGRRRSFFAECMVGAAGSWRHVWLATSSARLSVGRNSGRGTDHCARGSRRRLRSRTSRARSKRAHAANRFPLFGASS